MARNLLFDEDEPQPRRDYIEFDPDTPLLDQPAEPRPEVVLAQLSDRAVRDLHNLLDQVKFFGNQAEFAREKERITSMLAHWCAVYCQPHTVVKAGGTNVKWGESLAARALGYIFLERGYLEERSERVGKNGNFIADASDKFFEQLLCRVPGNDIPAVPAGLARNAREQQERLEVIRRRRDLKVTVHRQIAQIWRVVSGQQAAADSTSRSTSRSLKEQVRHLTAQVQVLTPAPAQARAKAPPALPGQLQLPFVAQEEGEGGDEQGAIGDEPAPDAPLRLRGKRAIDPPPALPDEGRLPAPKRRGRRVEGKRAARLEE